MSSSRELLLGLVSQFGLVLHRFTLLPLDLGPVMTTRFAQR